METSKPVKNSGDQHSACANGVSAVHWRTKPSLPGSSARQRNFVAKMQGSHLELESPRNLFSLRSTDSLKPIIPICVPAVAITEDGKVTSYAKPYLNLDR